MAYTNRKIVTDFIAESFNISCEKATRVLTEWHWQKQSRVSQVRFWHGFARSLGARLPPGWIDQFREVWCAAICPMPGMLGLIQTLQERGYQTAMLSNTTPMHTEIICKLGYYEYFCPVLLSYQIQAAKPHRRAYEILLEVLDRPASECLFIDDKEENVEAAKALGIDAIQFFSHDQLVQELSKRRILFDEHLFHGKQDFIEPPVTALNGLD